jgi:hypothetical protein
MSKNPFGQLSIRRDDEDEVEVRAQVKPVSTQPQTSTLSTGGQLFTSSQQAEQKKKKKVRPEEKAKLEEQEKEYTRGEEEDDGGFQTVQKKANKTRPLNQDINAEDAKNRKPKNKGAYLERNNKDYVKEGKRQFERHSGTGRGKEIAKGGAGGHHTWGNNPKHIAKETEKHEAEPGNEYLYYGRDEDQCNVIY